MTDWGLGAYELTAERLAPAATVAVEALRPSPGDRVVDVGCGTGNAALDAARAGASVVGVDPAERLLDVARRQAAAEGLEAEFVLGDAAALPAPDGAFDAALSVFGVIFAAAEAAAGELLRVVRGGGRIVITTWVDEGATAQVMTLVREALGGAPRPALWSDPDALRELFAPHPVSIEYASLAFDAASPAAYVQEQVEHHPMWLATRPQLEAAGRYDEVIAGATEIFAAANEDPSGFRTSSRYHVVSVAVA